MFGASQDYREALVLIWLNSSRSGWWEAGFGGGVVSRAGLRESSNYC